jgi:hypothetical protein
MIVEQDQVASMRFAKSRIEPSESIAELEEERIAGDAKDRPQP